MSNDQAKRLKLLRKISGLTIHQLSTKYNLSESTIKYWESESGGKISEKGAHKIIEAMRKEGVQCSSHWLLQGIGAYPQLIDVRVGSTLPLNENISDEMQLNREIDFFCQQNQNVITITLTDDSLEPLFSNQDTVGGIRIFSDDIKKCIGKICIIETEDNQIVVKKILQGEKPDLYHLYSINPLSTINPPIITNATIKSAAPVTRVWKRYL